MINNEPSHIEEEGYCMHGGCLRPFAVTSKIHLLAMAGTDRLPLSMNQNVIIVDRGNWFSRTFSVCSQLASIFQSDQPIKPAPKHKYLNVSSFQNGENGVNVNTFEEMEAIPRLKGI